MPQYRPMIGGLISIQSGQRPPPSGATKLGLVISVCQAPASHYDTPGVPVYDMEILVDGTVRLISSELGTCWRTHGDEGPELFEGSIGRADWQAVATARP